MKFRATELDKFFSKICHECLFSELRLDESTIGLPDLRRKGQLEAYLTYFSPSQTGEQSDHINLVRTGVLEPARHRLQPNHEHIEEGRRWRSNLMTTQTDIGTLSWSAAAESCRSPCTARARNWNGAAAPTRTSPICSLTSRATSKTRS